MNGNEGIMNRLLMISVTLVVPFVGLILAQERNRAPSIDSFTPSSTAIRICPFPRSSSLSDDPEVTLAVNAIDPDGDSLDYEYSTAEGTISGKGKSVTWDLRGLPYGPHEVRVTVTDGKGGKVEASLIVTTAVSGACDPPPPPCPVIKVSCPGELDHSKLFTFSAHIVEGDVKGYRPPSFNWKVNAGTIVNGQYSRAIEAKAVDGFDNLTATVDVGGFDPSCLTTASCSTKIIWRQEAPQFTLKDVNGRTVRLSDYKGKVVVINFWATWCPPCRAEMPELVRLQREHGKEGLQIIGVTYPPEKKARVQRFARSLKVNYPIILGTREFKARFSSEETLPLTVVINRDGKVSDIISGILLREEFDEKIKPLLIKEN
jgi:thiol-disulfide isomerase/thioredoxin